MVNCSYNKANDGVLLVSSPHIKNTGEQQWGLNRSGPDTKATEGQPTIGS